jgi:hypothetical protein
VDARHAEHWLRSMALAAEGPLSGMLLDTPTRAWFQRLLGFDLDADVRRRIEALLAAAAEPARIEQPAGVPPAGRAGAGGAGGRGGR